MESIIIYKEKNSNGWLLFNANSAIFQLHDGENKLHLDDDDDVCFVLDQHVELNFYSARSLKQQCTDRHVASHSLCSYSLMLRA